MFKLSRILNKKHQIIIPIRHCSTSKDDQKTLSIMKQTAVSTKKPAEVTKEDLQWRTPWHEKEGQYYSTLRTFYTEDNNTNIIKFLQQPIDLSPQCIKNWFAKRREKKQIMMQQYIPERNQVLGNELAAAHFVVFRAGSVKFFGDEKWIKANEMNEYNLPNQYREDMIVQAIDCENMELYYEGLVNLKGLKQVEWLSLNGCDNLDDWALDRISNIFSESLFYLDIRNLPLVTHRGLGALYKLRKLKILYVDDIFASSEFEMTCLMLQEIMPELDIRVN